MIVDFRRTRNKPNTVSVLGEEVEVVEEHSYLVVDLNSRLDWKYNTKVVFKKVLQCLHQNVAHFRQICGGECNALQPSVGAAASEPVTQRNLPN